MEFNRLSEVEKLEEVPTGASALAESDGKIVRVPLGGGDVKLEDLVFDLDVTGTGASVSFANTEQIQKAVDRNMTIRVVSYTDASGLRQVMIHELPIHKDTVYLDYMSEELCCLEVYTTGWGYPVRLVLYVDKGAYEDDEKIVILPTSPGTACIPTW